MIGYERDGHPECPVVLLDRLGIVGDPANALEQGPVGRFIARLEPERCELADLVDVRNEQAHPLIAAEPPDRFAHPGRYRTRNFLRRLGGPFPFFHDFLP